MSHRSRLLIVDDSPEDCAAYQRYLRRGGQDDFKVVLAHSAAGGLTCCRREMPDCILLDFSLPDCDGLEFLEQLQQEHGAYSPPVVMITGHGNESVAVQAMKLGAQDYLVKSLIADSLRHAIQNAIKGVALRREVERQQREVARLSEAQARLVQELERRAAELHAADKRKDEFLATLAHELRNPLAPLRNGLEVMKRSSNDPAAVELSRAMMERQLTQMVRLIDDLLDLSRISRGKIELRKEHVELVKAVHQAVETSRPMIEASGHTLTISFPPDPIMIEADFTRIAQVISNILNNAAKYTNPGGHITLTVELRENQAAVAVRDSGVGIPPEMLPSVFDIFMQVDRSLEKSQGGLGIGLSIVKGLIEMHGGKVEARSAGHGLGSEFIVTLPLAERQLPALPAGGAGQIAATRARRRILIVDDNRDAAISLAMLLKGMGNEIQTAFDGLQAIERAESFRPELILMDIGMPKLNGYDACRKIRETDWGKSMVLVALTGWGQEQDKHHSRQAGFNHHFVKPIDPLQLDELLCESKVLT